MSPLLRPIAGMMLALAAASAYAQAPAPLYLGEQRANEGTAALPILNNRSGQIEGFLLIEGQGRSGSALERMLGLQSGNGAGLGLVLPMDNGRRLGASLKFEPNTRLGMLCDYGSLSGGWSSVAQNCLSTALPGGESALSAIATPRPAMRTELSLEGDRSRVTASLGTGTAELSPVLLPGTGLSFDDQPLQLGLVGANIEQHDIGLLGEFELGESGWVSIGGTLARARVVGANQLPNGLRPGWNTGTIRLEGGVGDFGGEIIGRVVELPGAPGTYSDVGIGVTWRAPWQARLSVGATGLVSSGDNPFAANSENEEESNRVPFIRYEQDL